MQLSVSTNIEYWPQQSPIRLENAIYSPDLKIEFKDYGQRIHGHLEEATSGHGFNFVVDKTTACLKIEGQICPLKQLHFHARSEHYIGQSDAGLEIHLIHEIQNRPPGSQKVVVGVLLNPIEGGPKIKGLLDLNRAFAAMPSIAEGCPPEPQSIDFDARAFVPAKPLRFYRYEGSLTTPPFSETISWVVMADILDVDAAAINDIVKASTHDARPLQCLNRRFVLCNFT